MQVSDNVKLYRIYKEGTYELKSSNINCNRHAGE